jgi:dinuclear metal center YbgI/SA1388 family protein
MQVKELLRLFEEEIPSAYQESYDNCGLQVGDPDGEVKGALLTLDVTDAVLDEALTNGCNVIIAHHPLIFTGLKKMTGKNYVQRLVMKAIRENLHIIALHTNLDNQRQGVNARIASRLGLINTRVLQPLGGKLNKLVVFVPESHAVSLQSAIFAAGAGSIGDYSECSYSVAGTGTFKPGEHADPYIGSPSGTRETVSELRMEFIAPAHLRKAITGAMRAAHPYEEPAFDWFALEQEDPYHGAGLVGELPQSMSEGAFLSLLKDKMRAAVVRHSPLLKKEVRRVAVCGGSGSFLLKDAINCQADVYVSADFKYHQFFDAEDRIVIADIGHYESEQFTPEIFSDILKKKNVTFAVLLSTLDTNPIKYF